MIESVQNPKVKYLVKLRRARVRRREGLFIVEGHREIKVGLQAEAALEEAFFCPALFSGGEQEACLAALEERGVSLVEMAQASFEKVSIRENPDGLLVLARTWEVDLTGLKLGSTPLVLVGDGLEKPGNLGAILRSAAAMSVDAVLCVDPNLDLFNPNVVRASQGQLFRVPAWVGDKEEALSFLRRRELRICATSAKAKTSMWEANLKGATAIVIGSEAHGLDSFWLDAADDWLTIPMLGEVDSLNLSVAAGCLLAEVNRQRRTTG
jgi:TrmH family RNA methyltransferase